jgi:hypothetical protein
MPPQLTKYFYCNSGSEAVDNAVKIARAATGRECIIAFDVSRCFSGRQKAFSDVTGGWLDCCFAVLLVQGRQACCQRLRLYEPAAPFCTPPE